MNTLKITLEPKERIKGWIACWTEQMVDIIEFNQKNFPDKKMSRTNSMEIKELSMKIKAAAALAELL